MNTSKHPTLDKVVRGGCPKRSQVRGARKIDERKRTTLYVGARRLSATKQMSLFQQPPSVTAADHVQHRLPFLLFHNFQRALQRHKKFLGTIDYFDLAAVHMHII
jgi:hypothetical protein